MELALSTIAVITASIFAIGLIVYYISTGKKNGGDQK